MEFKSLDPARALLVEVQRRLPAGQRLLQEAFTTDHRRPVLVKITDLAADTFYFFDEPSARAFADAIVDLAAQHGRGELTVSYPSGGEFRAQCHRLQHLANRLDKIQVLAVGAPPRLDWIFRYHDIAGNPLLQYRLAMKTGAAPCLFIGRERHRIPVTDNPRSLGFFTFDAETIEEVSEDIEQLLRGLTGRLGTFHKLEMLHHTTQRVTRELESYSRRIDLAIRQAQRRPDLLTPARVERIVHHAIAKMEQLKEIPRRALRTIDKPRR